MKRHAFIALILGIAGVLILCDGPRAENGGAQEKKLHVVASLFPLYDFAKNIGGEHADVRLLLPPGVEPHEFEPATGDILAINKADVFIFTGGLMEPWVAGVLKGVTNSRLLAVDASTGVSLMRVAAPTDRGAAGTVDPHIWLDFDNDRIIIDTILSAFVQKDPGNREYYAGRARAYQEKLAALDNAYRSALGRCGKNVFVEGGHHTFGYLARRYHLRYFSAVGISPDAEPRPRDLMALSDTVKRYGLKYVYFEELVSPKVAQTIARETGARLLKLNGAHNLTRDEMRRGTSFLSLMEQNLENLKKGLECG